VPPNRMVPSGKYLIQALHIPRGVQRPPHGRHFDKEEGIHWLQAAGKAYLTSLGQAMAHEVERHGVGVTVSAPGAVWTSFAAASHSETALCFQIPFYPLEASSVAREAVDATLAGQLHPHKPLVTGIGPKGFFLRGSYIFPRSNGNTCKLHEKGGCYIWVVYVFWNPRPLVLSAFY
jgi:hypothetical protein